MIQRELLIAGANLAYDMQDQAWFNGQSTDDLVILWQIACDLANGGAVWDDEVYEALADRDYFGS